MRRLIVALALLACAQPSPPPGGPEDRTPPKLLSESPDSGAVNARPKEVDLQFDDVVSERPAGGNATELDQLVLISPYDGAPRVGWHRSRISIRPRHDWKANTPYTVTLLPGLADLRGNVRKEATTIVFSTGPTIPTTSISGMVFDWAADRPQPSATVFAIARPDSVLYVTRADSTGAFRLEAIPPGTYTVIGFNDANNNFALDPREAFDSMRVALRDTARVEVLAFVHDTIGPSISAITPSDSVTLRVTFDRPIAPAQRIDTSAFTLKRADSTVVPLRLAVSARTWDSTHVDTTARADTGARGAAVPARARPPLARPGAPPGVAGRAGRDTTRPAAPVPKPSKPAPITEVVIVTARPLAPGTSYRLHATGLRNLLGKPGTSSRAFTVPKVEAAKAAPAGARPSRPARPARPGADTTRRAPVDTTRRARPDSTRHSPLDTTRRSASP